MITKNKLTIKDLALEDRPREKVLQKGVSSLSDAELMAILIGSGNSEKTAIQLSQYILNSCDNNLSKLAKLSVRDLEKFKGIGEAKAINIIAALEIGRRRKLTEPLPAFKIIAANDAFEFIHADLMDLSHEEFWIILLKRNNTALKKIRISSGGVSGTVVDPKIIFKRAIEEKASSMIVAHNHPSGNLTPSEADVRLTKKIKEAGQFLDILLLDHLIVTDNDFFSFAENSYL